MVTGRTERWRRAAVLAAALLGGVASCAGQTRIEVVKPGSPKTAIEIARLAVPPGAAGATFMQTLQNDLVRSGWFEVVAPGRAAVVLTGRLDAGPGGSTASCTLANAAAARNYFARDFRSDEPVPRRLAHEVADAIVTAVKRVPGIASTRIAMIVTTGTRKDVYVCDADGAGLTRVTGDGAACLSPNWWPDASGLVYTSYCRGYPDVYRLDFASRQRRPLSSFPGINAGADVAPDARQLALVLSRDGNPELYTMDLQGGALTRLTRTPRASEASPSWSPDGRQIVFVSDRAGQPQLYITARGGRTETRITFRGSENVAPDWGPDGRIVYSSRRGGRYQLCVFDPADGEHVQFTDEAVDHEDPSWAPDGRHIVYARTSGYRSELWVLDTGGDAPVRLIGLGGDCGCPAWSPK